MAEFSAPFDGSPIATQSQWSRMARRWGLDGVHASDPADAALKVTGNGSGNVTLSAGEAFVNGFYYKNDATKTIAITANGGAAARIDMVVLRASMSAKTVTAVYKTGGTSAPTLSADESGEYEMPLAQCTIAAGSSVVTAVNVADRRWFTDRGAMPSLPGTRRPSITGQLLVEGSTLYVGDGIGWQWLASPGIEDGTYTPQWSSGSANFHWGTAATNIGRYIVRGKRVDLLIHVVATANPPAYSDPIMVSLPPGFPAAVAHRSILNWTYTSANEEGGGIGSAVIYPTSSTTKIARLRYAMSNSVSSTGVPNAFSVYTNKPWNIRAGDILTIDGSYWLA
ncbi:hypothetical protein EES43_24665 [Streptomyces sp. ADI96-02]|uniref:hypothetical protein n=1 Tax=Streptomyces sp. ADI96-02 TaxID=1522760 RepID=UPI000F55282A|nr:hypothetical protein [Streptomyces sp. ADI96-02]RPK56239.1 hypothetical protein EES43_24665 [Streptomyces sp. ADI96-02]